MNAQLCGIPRKFIDIEKVHETQLESLYSLQLYLWIIHFRLSKACTLLSDLCSPSQIIHFHLDHVLQFTEAFSTCTLLSHVLYKRTRRYLVHPKWSAPKTSADYSSDSGLVLSAVVPQGPLVQCCGPAGPACLMLWPTGPARFVLRYDSRQRFLVQKTGFTSYKHIRKASLQWFIYKQSVST